MTIFEILDELDRLEAQEKETPLRSVDVLLLDPNDGRNSDAESGDEDKPNIEHPSRAQFAARNELFVNGEEHVPPPSPETTCKNIEENEDDNDDMRLGLNDDCDSDAEILETEDKANN